jgi:hypothetical protein
VENLTFLRLEVALSAMDIKLLIDGSDLLIATSRDIVEKPRAPTLTSAYTARAWSANPTTG